MEPPSPPRFPRAEVEAAFRRTRAAQDADDWNAYCDLLSEDAVYVEHHFGTFRGREAIRAWLVPVMAPLPAADSSPTRRTSTTSTRPAAS